MLDGIDALSALERFGTVSEAATRLRLTQSAVSKRLQALQAALGFAVIEPDGRRVRLTPRALDLLERARPIVADLRSLTTSVGSATDVELSLGLSDSIAASWGPRVVARVSRALGGIVLSLHVHRSVLLVENVRLGRYHMGLATEMPGAKDLIRIPVVAEPLVVVNVGVERQRRKGVPLITIEPESATWRAIEGQIARRHASLLAERRISVESFGAALQMARAGFGDALVPLGMAKETGIERGRYRALPGVERPISLFTRKTIYLLDDFRRLRERLVAEAARYFGHEAGKAPGQGERQRS
jgi:DNA-binding transcriptional LysR family regulator